MPARQRQYHVRLDPGTEVEFDALRARIAKILGTRLTANAIINMAVRELERKYASNDAAVPEVPTVPGPAGATRRGRRD